jgi:uncharacterized membrane protein
MFNSQENKTFQIDLAKFNIPILLISGFIILANGFILYKFISLFYDNRTDNHKTILLFVIPLIIFAIVFIVMGFVIVKTLKNPIRRIIIENNIIQLITKQNLEYNIYPEFMKSIDIRYTFGPRQSTTSFTFFIDNSMFDQSFVKESFGFTNYHIGDVAKGERTTQLIQFLSHNYPDKVKLHNVTWI